MKENVAKTYRLLEDVAHAGLPCPSNWEIAAQIGVHSPGSASSYVRDLELRGLIEVKRTRSGRNIVIVASGKQISSVRWSSEKSRDEGRRAEPLAMQAFPERSPTADRAVSQDDVALRFVDSRTCFNCGARWGQCDHTRGKA